jgi:hypothetical protein
MKSRLGIVVEHAASSVRAWCDALALMLLRVVTFVTTRVVIFITTRGC